MLMAIVGLTLLPALVVCLASKWSVLARTRAGWVFYAANVFYELGVKKFRLQGLRRSTIDAGLMACGLAGVALASGSLVATLGVALVCALHELAIGWANQALLTQVATRMDRSQGIDAQLPVPELGLIVRGPFVSYGLTHDLGVVWATRPLSLEVLVLNHGPVPLQYPLELAALADAGIACEVQGPEGPAHPGPSEVVKWRLIVVASPTSTPVRIVVRLRTGGIERTRVLRIAEARTELTAVRAEVRRWKYGHRAAFAWRGDQDLYDPPTFQDAQGLREVLGLARRYRMPSTLYLSGRLSLVEDEHRQFCTKLGLDKRTAEIPSFVDFLRREVTLEPEQEFPHTSGTLYACELGNHYYLHYQSYVVAHEGNGWTWDAGLAAGTYPWMTGSKGDTLAEQRDNARANADLFERVLGVRPASWGIPARCNDANTPRALEAAGVEVSSDSNARRADNVLRMRPPHIPEGCDRLVELTKVYPGDPLTYYHHGMLRWWLGHALRTGKAFVFMGHHHLRLYQSAACIRYTEALLRDVISGSNDAFWPATITAIGRYWRDVLSPTCRALEVRVEAGRVWVKNSGSRNLEAIPVDIELAGGGRTCALLTLGPGEQVQL
jgi:hypothetical protein